MQHAWARQTISRLLTGSSLGATSVVIARAAELHERIDRTSAEALWQRTLALPLDQATPYTGALNQQPIPADETSLLAQLTPLVTAHPSDTGLNLGVLSVLADLWPHVASDERPLLRVRFLNGLMERENNVGNRGGTEREAVVTGAELKVWNRYMPTATGGEGTVADLQRILSAPTAQEAYHQFADHLVGGIDPATLARILGSLALQLANQRRDPHGVMLLPLTGAMAAEHLAAICPPEAFSTALSQLAHQLWWCASRADLAIRSEDDRTAETLAAGITSGAAMAVRRRARAMRLDEAGWWAELGPAADAIAAKDQTPRAVLALWTLAKRSGNRVVAPDDAAAIAALLADGA